MLSLLSRGRVFLACLAVDMRRSIDGLSGLVRDRLGDDPLSGDLFVFSNRRRDRIKILVWDRSGFWVLYKRLEKGTFEWPKGLAGDERVELSIEELALVLGGIELAGMRRRKWHFAKVA